MVNRGVNKAEQLDRIFAALANPTRRAVLQRLAIGDASVGELGAPFKMSAPAVTKHLHVLEDAGLVRREVDGRIHRIRLDADPLKDATAWMASYAKFWGDQFDALDQFLAKTDPTRKPRRRHKKEE
ncbi:MAG TPA: metalloregulator ArsR/SmtB family transcription factor [Candidatus Dormibacteraeota bacterium]